MSESLNMVEVGSHVARDKAVRATVTAEAVRQSGTPNPSWLRNRNANPQAQTRSEARRSIVSETRSNAVGGDAEPLDWWRRQYPSSSSAVMAESSGVAGWACRESCSKESGRSATVLNGWECICNWLQRTRPTWSCRNIHAFEVRGAISVTCERRSNAAAEVGWDDSSEEVPVMGMDAKRPHFDGVTGTVTASPNHRNV
ncbi:MAG: hypothetical protein PXY39_07655 [archaeon]|nr:hypothetical protein [archaeon]